MLREIEVAGAAESGLKRRWFNDKDMDLFIWADERDQITRFQLSGDSGGEQRALTWTRASGLLTHRVDDGEENFGKYKRTPILQPCEQVDVTALVDRFVSKSKNLEPEIVEFVGERVVEALPGED